MRAKMLALVGALVMWGCEQPSVEQPAGSTITFGSPTMSLGGRALVTQESVDDGSVPIYVHAIADNTRLYPVSNWSQGEQITQDMSTAKWLPSNSNNEREWQSGTQYTFNAFAYTPTDATSNGSLTIGSNGKEITVSQPDSYEPSEMVDYLYSHSFTVADGAMRPLVMLDLEHAMALVEIHIFKHESIAEAYLDYITISNFYNNATMICKPTIYNSGGNNEWQIALSGNDDTVYTLDGGNYSNEVTRIELEVKESESAEKLTFLAIPQQMDVRNLLSVGYWVNEKFDEESEDNFVHHAAEFKLYNYYPIVWQSGHHIVYTLEVDTGIHLEGVIVPWVDVDYIEGTVLPDLGYESE